MAAIATTLFEPVHDWNAVVAERNAELMAEQAARRRATRTPEFFFTRRLDNSRLIKAADPVRVREMRIFSGAMAVLLTFLMFYGLQHFYAIECSYRVEQEKQALDQMREENRQLRLAEAQLTQPGRIDLMARQYGLTEPQPGQVLYPAANAQANASAEARAVMPAAAAVPSAPAAR